MNFWQSARSELHGINLPLAGLLLVICLIILILMFLIAPAALGTAFGACVAIIIAFVAYPWQKDKDRQLKIEEEKRKAIADLIYASEGYLVAVAQARPVAVSEVPSFSVESSEMQKATALIIAYGCVETNNAVLEYWKAIDRFVRLLKDEKPLRANCEPIAKRPGSVSRTKEYKNAQDSRVAAWRDVTKLRDELFKRFGDDLGVRVPAPELIAVEPEQDNDQ